MKVIITITTTITIIIIIITFNFVDYYVDAHAPPGKRHHS